MTRLTRPSDSVQSNAWLPDNRHLAVTYSSGTLFQSDLGVLDVQDGSISRLTLNVAQSVDSPSLSADGSRVIATVSQIQREVWKVPLGPDPDANGRAAVRLLDSTLDPMWNFVSRDGRTLLFNNATSGSRNLWTMPLDRSAPPRQITAIAGDAVMHSSLSPDGSRVAFASSATGSSDIWTQNVDGSDLRQLTNDGAHSWPVWSPDGREIVFQTQREGRSETWHVPSAGGSAEKLWDGGFRGDWISAPKGNGTRIVSLSPGGVRLLDVERRAVLWAADQHLRGGFPMPIFSPDGQLISVSFQEKRDRDAIWIFETATGKSRLAVRFPGPFRMNFRASWVDDGRAFIVNRNQTISHIVVFDRFWVK